MKKWNEAPSLNFKVAISKDMLFGEGITKNFQTCSTRSIIPKELRPRSNFSFDKSYVIAFIQNVFDKLGATVHHEILTDTLFRVSQSDRPLKLSITVHHDCDDGYTDDFGNDYLIASKLVEYLAITENPNTARNEKATKLANSIAQCISKGVYQRAYDDYFRTKANRL